MSSSDRSEPCACYTTDTDSHADSTPFDRSDQIHRMVPLSLTITQNRLSWSDPAPWDRHHCMQHGMVVHHHHVTLLHHHPTSTIPKEGGEKVNHLSRKGFPLLRHHPHVGATCGQDREAPELVSLDVCLLDGWGRVFTPCMSRAIVQWSPEFKAWGYGRTGLRGRWSWNDTDIPPTVNQRQIPGHAMATYHKPSIFWRHRDVAVAVTQ